MERKPRGPCGRWRGTYTYDVSTDNPGPARSVEFELSIEQGALQRIFGRFRGTVTDARTEVEQGTGTLRGLVRGSAIRFVKRMPIAFVHSNGRSMLLSERLAELGHPGLPNPKGTPIRYAGRFEDPDQASGVWVVRARHMRVARGVWVRTARTTGTWTMRRSTETR